LDRFFSPYICNGVHGCLGDLQQALQHFEQYRLAGDNYYGLRTDANLQLVRVYMKLAERGAKNETLAYVSKAYEASIRSENIILFDAALISDL
jgi:hypothetical protein